MQGQPQAALPSNLSQQVAQPNTTQVQHPMTINTCEQTPVKGNSEIGAIDSHVPKKEDDKPSSSSCENNDTKCKNDEFTEQIAMKVSSILADPKMLENIAKLKNKHNGNVSVCDTVENFSSDTDTSDTEDNNGNFCEDINNADESRLNSTEMETVR